MKKKNGMRLGLVTGLIIVIMIGYINMPRPVLRENDQGFAVIEWLGAPLVSANETVPSATAASSCLEIYIVNHTATPSTTFNGTSHNSSSRFENWAETNLDADGAGSTYNATSYFTGCAGDATGGFGRTMTIKRTTTFDIVVRIRGNVTNIGNGVMYIASKAKMKLNTTGAYTLSTDVHDGWGMSYNGTYASGRFMYMNFYWNNGGAGYTLTSGQTLSITDIQLLFNY